MTNKTWTVMNDLDEAFSQITAFRFLLEQLQNAVDNNDSKSIADTTVALNAFMNPFEYNWDSKFKIAWNHVMTLSTSDEKLVCPPCEPCEPCDLFSPE